MVKEFYGCIMTEEQYYISLCIFYNLMRMLYISLF